MGKELQVPRIAVGAVIKEHGKVLLVKRKRPPAEGLWAIPGGKVKWGETLEDALKREIEEEAHVKIEIEKFLKTVEVFARNEKNEIVFHYVILDYLARIKEGEPFAGDDALEIRWFTKNELDEFPVTETTRQLLREQLDF